MSHVWNRRGGARVLRALRVRRSSIARDLESCGERNETIAAVTGCVAVIFASGARAQSVSGRVTGTVGEVGSVAGQANVSLGAERIAGGRQQQSAERFRRRR